MYEYVNNVLREHVDKLICWHVDMHPANVFIFSYMNMLIMYSHSHPLGPTPRGKPILRMGNILPCGKQNVPFEKQDVPFEKQMFHAGNKCSF